jgi:hypothetical protein
VGHPSAGPQVAVRKAVQGVAHLKVPQKGRMPKMRMMPACRRRHMEELGSV